jgi:hypothetical protein
MTNKYEREKKYTMEHTKSPLSNVHALMGCAGHDCPIHNRSDHPMRSFPQHWRSDRCIMERTCPCGVGHPDPDDVSAAKRLGRYNDGYTTHGCCGCCGAAKHLVENGMSIADVYDYIACVLEQERNDRDAEYERRLKAMAPSE